MSGPVPVAVIVASTRDERIGGRVAEWFVGEARARGDLALDVIDLVNPEWRAEPVAFVSYGGLAGGLRVVEQLREVVVELHMVSLRDGVALPFAGRSFREGTAPHDPEGMIADGVRITLDRLVWWSRALAGARAANPYDG